MCSRCYKSHGIGLSCYCPCHPSRRADQIFEGSTWIVVLALVVFLAALKAAELRKNARRVISNSWRATESVVRP